MQPLFNKIQFLIAIFGLALFVRVISSVITTCNIRNNDKSSLHPKKQRLTPAK